MIQRAVVADFVFFSVFSRKVMRFLPRTMVVGGVLGIVYGGLRVDVKGSCRILFVGDAPGVTIGW